METKIVSVSSNGDQANDYSYSPSISADGRYITYMSYANNLVNGDSDRAGFFLVGGGEGLSGLNEGVTGDDIFVYDTVTKNTSRVNVSSSGEQASNYLADIYNNETGEYVGILSLGSFSPDISGDGRYVTYASYATNLVPGNVSSGADIFLYDTVTKQTTRVSVDNKGNSPPSFNLD